MREISDGAAAHRLLRGDHMRISQLMTAHPVTCLPTDSLHEAARLMWDRDVGCLPVVDSDRRVLGILTDRDIAISAFARDQRLSEIPATVAMADQVYTCNGDDPIELAAHIMADKGVRRLPVVDADGRVVGIISLDDLAAAAVTSPDASSRAVASALATISGTV
jgi:CBS domain-containing protein